MEVLFLEAKRLRGELFGQPGPSHAEALTAPPEYAEFSSKARMALDLVCSGEAKLCGILHGNTVYIAEHRPSETEWRGLHPGFVFFRIPAFEAVIPPRRKRGLTVALALAVVVLGVAAAWGHFPRDAKLPNSPAAPIIEAVPSKPMPPPSEDSKATEIVRLKLKTENEQYRKGIAALYEIVRMANSTEGFGASVSKVQELIAAVENLNAEAFPNEKKPPR